MSTSCFNCSVTLFFTECPGTEATDDRKVFESHAESGKTTVCECACGIVIAIGVNTESGFQITLWSNNISPIPQCFQAPPKHKKTENGTVDAVAKECNGAPLLSECALQEARDDLQLHLCLSALFTLPVMLGAPSLIHWIRNLRYSIEMTDRAPILLKWQLSKAPISKLTSCQEIT